MCYSLIESRQLSETEISATVKTDENSPWFAGHFPDDPILPGIAQLGMVADIINRFSKENLLIRSLSRIKFKRLIRPGELLSIQATYEKRKNNYSFRITVDGIEAGSGVINLAKSG